MTHCSFCHDIKQGDRLLETTHFYLVYDHDPIQSGHLLLISKDHIETISSLADDALIELIHLEKNLIERLEQQLPIEGITLIQNNGKLMDPGTHFHVHLVPRYQNDAFWETHTVKPQELDLNHMTTLLRRSAEDIPTN